MEPPVPQLTPTIIMIHCQSLQPIFLGFYIIIQINMSDLEYFGVLVR
jgi:hypothetical protein